MIEDGNAGQEGDQASRPAQEDPHTTHAHPSPRQASRKELEQEIARLKDVEERYRLAAKATSDAVWDWDLVTNTLSWNENLYILFGYSPSDDPHNINWWYEQLHPDDREDVITHIHKVIDNSGNYWQDEYRFRKKDGNYAMIIDRGYILFNEQGKAIRMVGAMQDVTERKNTRKIEKFLQEATETLYSSLDYTFTLTRTVQLCVPILADLAFIDLLNEDGSVRRVTYAQTGTTRDTIAKDPVHYPPAQALFEGKHVLISNAESEEVSKLIEQEQHTSLVPALKSRSLISVPIESKDEKIGALTLVVTEPGRTYAEKDLKIALDLAKRVAVAVENAQLYKAQVEARKELEHVTRALKASEELFRRMQEASVDGFVLLECVRNDNKEIVDFKWKYHNHAATELIPGLHEDLRDKKLLELYPFIKNKGIYSKLVEVIETGVAKEHELYYHYNGMDKWVRFVAVKINSGVGVSFSDITQAKSLDKQKDEFIGLASHELKTPLTSIWGYLQLLEQAEKVEMNKRYISKILTQVKRLQSLIADLLDVSKIQAGKLKLQRTDFSLNDLIDECIESTRLSNTGYEILREGERNGFFVSADRSRIEQVITNLISNAIKYSPGSNKVIVKLERKNNKAIVSITDFGIGITPQEQNKIFERFHQVNSNKKFQGLGLGLYISRDIVERHNGRIWLESEPGKGSTFHFSLPLISKST